EMYGTGGPPEPAHKVRVRELGEGEFEEISLNQVRYFRLPWGSISKVRIMGIVISSWKNEDGSFARLEIHDGTGSIQVKAWDEDVSKMTDPATGELYEIGVIVDVIGRIRCWRESLYLYPILMSRVRDPNMLLLRELEILRRALRYKIPPSQTPEFLVDGTLIKLLKELGPLSIDEIADLLKWNLDVVSRKLEELRDLGLIYKEDGKYVYIG
ncbi:MAG TPA: hypothetical protein ENF57_02290, partial [Candidatus Korarchaeota archaeon]|nr:hypothetical protein [Candidatus Korarchaeota archaeon]